MRQPGKQRMRFGVLALALAVAGLSAVGAQAQSTAAPVSDAGVARLSLINGDVSMQRGDTGDWQSGAINAPLLSGDSIAAGADSRAAVQLDYADFLRLSDNTQANLVNLTKQQIQVQLAAGTIDYVVLTDAQASSEIDTPNIAVRPRGAGVFRIEVSGDNQTRVIVRRGEADISTPQGSTRLHQGQLITVVGTDTPEYKITHAPGEDAWDRWNHDRDRSIETASAFRHTNRYYAGIQSLDGYGHWVYVPGYGSVWSPNESVGWSPYSNGTWVWEPGWGWTWVANEPWGWAPYHYGRWFMYDASWVWWPGPITPYYRPMWAPAYVSFIGWSGGGFSAGIGFGSIGWVPIGPCDPYRPWWGGRGFSRINITNVTVINNYEGGHVYPPLAGAGRPRYSNLDALTTNPRVRRAVMRVPATDFERGVVGMHSHVTASEIRSGSLMGGRLPVVPARASLTVGHGPVRAFGPVRPQARHFFGGRTAPRQPSFTAEQTRIHDSLRREGVAVRPVPREMPNRFGSGARVVEPRGNARANNGGFRRFGGATAPRGNAQPRPGAAVPRGNVQPRPGGNRPANNGGFQGFGGAPRGNVQPRSEPAPRGNPQPQPGPAPRFNQQPQAFSPAPQNFPRYRAPARPQYSNPGFARPAPAPQPMRSYRPSFRPSAPAPAYRPPLQVGHPIVRSAPMQRGSPIRQAEPRR